MCEYIYNVLLYFELLVIGDHKTWLLLTYCHGKFCFCNILFS